MSHFDIKNGVSHEGRVRKSELTTDLGSNMGVIVVTT